MKRVQRYTLVGETIESLVYKRYKKQLIFVLKNEKEVLMNLPNVNRYGDCINECNLMTKNHQYINYEFVKNIEIKDLGWESLSNKTAFMFIIDANGDIYRFNCKYNIIGVPDNELYDYSEYLRRENNGIKARFNRYFYRYEKIN